MSVSVKARVVFPVDRPPIENGVVTIEDSRIVDIGTQPFGGEIIDLSSAALLPGLVNAHTHLEFSYLQRPLGTAGMPFVDWIRLVIAERGRGTGSPQEAFIRGRDESRTCGVTTIGDITTSQGNRIRRVDITHFQEVIGFSRARAASAFNALVATSPEFGPSDLSVKVAKARQQRKRIGISPHAPYTVSPHLLEKLVSLAGRTGMPMAMHIAETREELELLESGEGPFQELLEERSMWDQGAIPLGSRPMNYLKLLAAAPRSLVIHGNYLADDELAFLGANQERMSLVYCPRTHAYFDHKPYPLRKALTVGARVALGTDSLASNPDLSLLEEMRFVARDHSEVSPHNVLRMGTLSGAESLGRDEDVGSLTVGKLANMVAVPLADDVAGGLDGALESLLSSNERVSEVWVRGVHVKRGRHA